MPKKKKRRGLGSPHDYHNTRAEGYLQQAAVWLDSVEHAAKVKDCNAVWDHLTASVANLSAANAEIAGEKFAPKHETQISTLFTRYFQLRNTLGFQCTRQLKK